MLSAQPLLSERDMECLEGVMAVAFQRALASLSQMLNCKLAALEFRLRELSLKEVSTLLGSPEAPVVGVYLAFHGRGGCQTVLIFPPDTVRDLLELMLGGTVGDAMALDELQTSALSEMGNVMANSFVGHLADILGMEVPCVPPAVVADMGGAIVQEVLLRSGSLADRVLMVRSLFGEGGRELAGVFLVVPDWELMSRLRERCQ